MWSNPQCKKPILKPSKIIMAIETYFERISRIDRLIRLKATGSPSDLAQRLQISESGLYRYIGYMHLQLIPKRQK